MLTYESRHSQTLTNCWEQGRGVGREGIGITVALKALKKTIMFSNQQFYELSWSNDRSSNSKPLSTTKKWTSWGIYFIGTTVALT